VKGWNLAERIGEMGRGTRIDAALSIEEDAYSASRGYGNWCAVLRELRPALATVSA
jgi:hypothetical protein